MSNTDDLVVRIGARGQADTQRAIRDVRQEVGRTAREVRALDRVTRGTAAGGMARMDRALGLGRRRAQEFHGKLRDVSSYLTGAFGRALRTAAIGVTALAAATTGFGLRTAAGLETSQVQLEGLVGSVERAAQLRQELVGLDPLVPFSISELQTATATLLNFGSTADTVVGQLRGIADVAAGTADPSQAFARIARAVGQIQASGFVRAEELNQLVDAGAAPWQAMAAAFDSTVGDLRNRMERGEDLPAAPFLAEFLAGRPGQAERVATTTLTGLLSSVRSRIELGLADAASPLVTAIKDALPAVEDGIGVLMDQVAPPLLQLGTMILNVLVAALPRVAPLLGALAAGAERLLGAAAPAFAMMDPVLTAIEESLVELVDVLVPVMPDLVAAFVALVGVLPSFVRLLAALVPLVTPIANLITELLQIDAVRGMAAGLLAVLLGYRALGGIITILQGFAAGLFRIAQGQAAVAATGAAPGGPAGRGGLLSMLGGAAMRGGLGFLGGQAITGAITGNDTPGEQRFSNVVGQNAGMIAAGSQWGLPGAIIGTLGAIGNTAWNLWDASRDNRPGGAAASSSDRAAGAGGGTTVDQSMVLQPGAIGPVYAASDVDLERAITAGIEQYERDRAERGA